VSILHKSTQQLTKILALYYRNLLKFRCKTGNINIAKTNWVQFMPEQAAGTGIRAVLCIIGA
jgi:hypothetical protein